MRYFRLLLGTLCALVITSSQLVAADGPLPGPKVGEKAPDFTLKTLKGDSVSLAKTRAEGPVVLVMLRGWPGYQCPACTSQVGELLGQKDALKAHKATVLLVYPGSAERLTDRAQEFITGKDLPAHFRFVTDPDYSMVNAWKLRWDAPKETAYPSTYVIDGQGTIRFAKVSQTHGGRAKTVVVLKTLEKLAK